MLYTTGYSDGQQQQLNDDDDEEESALCIHSPSYGSTTIHHSPPPPPPQAFVSMDHPCRRPSKPSTDLVLPALDPKYLTNPQLAPFFKLTYMSIIGHKKWQLLSCQNCTRHAIIFCVKNDSR